MSVTNIMPSGDHARGDNRPRDTDSAPFPGEWSDDYGEVIDLDAVALVIPLHTARKARSNP